MAEIPTATKEEQLLFLAFEMDCIKITQRSIYQTQAHKVKMEEHKRVIVATFEGQSNLWEKILKLLKPVVLTPIATSFMWPRLNI